MNSKRGACIKNYDDLIDFLGFDLKVLSPDYIGPEIKTKSGGYSPYHLINAAYDGRSYAGEGTFKPFENVDS